MHLCSTCGRDNQTDANFCSGCGATLNGNHGGTLTGFLPPQTLLGGGRYQILETIGKGGMGAVYKALDLQLNKRIVAIKEMSQHGLTGKKLQDAIDAFVREAEMLAHLKHQSLPQIYEQFEENTRRYLVMEYIEGETVEQRLEHIHQQRATLPLEQVLAIGKQLCLVLDYLHSRQPPIIFRDLKPSNIMLNAQGHISLIDFGIARFFKPGQVKDTVALGSTGYAPPEQYRQATSPRSDIYSLGATLHQMLTGIDPSQAPFFFQPLSVNIPRLENLVQQMVSLDAKSRPANMSAVHQILESIDPSGHAPPTISRSPTRKSHRTSRQASSIATASAPIRVYALGSPYPEDKLLWGGMRTQLLSIVDGFPDVLIEECFSPQKAVHSELDTAHLIVLLLSKEFLASSECMELANHILDGQEAILLAVITRSCSLVGSRFFSLKIASDDALSHPSLYAQEQRILEVARVMRKLMVRLVVEKTSGSMNLLQWLIYQLYGDGHSTCPYFRTGSYTIKHIHPTGLAGIVVQLFDHRRHRPIAQYLLKLTHSPDLSTLLQVLAPSITDPEAIQGVASRRNPFP